MSHLWSLKARRAKVLPSLVKFPCVMFPSLWPQYRLRRAIAEFSSSVTTSDLPWLMQPVATLAPLGESVECCRVVFFLLEPEAER